MTDQALPRPVSLPERLADKADLCAHDGADDIAELLMEAVVELRCLCGERDALAVRVSELEAEREVLVYERNRARAQFNSSIGLLTGIHSLIYPAPFTTPEGKTMVFRPQSIDPHELLQELSDRIRALPDKLAALTTTPESKP